MIRELRQQLGYTQKELAKILNTSEATISRAENNSKHINEKTKQMISSKLKDLAINRKIENKMNNLFEENDRIIADHYKETAQEVINAKQPWWKKFCRL